jgi:hypothetical protein
MVHGHRHRHSHGQGQVRGTWHLLDINMDLGTDMDTNTGHRVLNTSRPRHFSKDSDIDNNFNLIIYVMWDSTLFSPNRIFRYQAQSDIVLHGILDWVPTYAEGVALLETCEKYVLYIYSTYTSF